MSTATTTRLNAAAAAAGGTSAELAKVEALRRASRERIARCEAAGQAPQERLTDEQVAAFHRDGFVCVPAERVWTLEEFDLMVGSVGLMEAWPDAPGKYLRYMEDCRLPGREGERILCRIERFVEYNRALADVVAGEKMLAMTAQLFGEASVLFKEKVNLKLPGADGFVPHQDAAAGWDAYGQDLHISTLVSIDAATEANGALALVRGRHREGLFGPMWEAIPDDVVRGMDWELHPTAPGDVVFFDSFVPHRSGPNPSPVSRRVLYTTFAKRSQGDHRQRYYADKTASLPQDCERDPAKTYAYRV